MKKSGKVAVAILVAVLICMGVVVNGIEKNKQSPTERGSGEDTRQTADVTEDADVQEMSSEAATEEAASEQPLSETWWFDTPGDAVVSDIFKSLKIELVSYDVVSQPDPDIYPAEYFVDGETPAKLPVSEETDWEKVYAEAPELDRIHSATYGVYTREEIMAANEKYQDIIDKYTTKNTNGGGYYFIRCRVTNMTDEDVDSNLFYDVLYKSADGSEVTYDENICYFDKAVNVEGEARDHRFYFINYPVGETVECTLGFAVRNKFGDDDVLYFGFPPTGDDPYDPDDVPDLVRIDNIPRIENK